MAHEIRVEFFDFESFPVDPMYLGDVGVMLYSPEVPYNMFVNYSEGGIQDKRAHLLIEFLESVRPAVSRNTSLATAIQLIWRRRYTVTYFVGELFNVPEPVVLENGQDFESYHLAWPAELKRDARKRKLGPQHRLVP